MSDVLFVCVHNAGRSQMAKAIFNSLAEERRLPWRAESAGTQPSPTIHRSVLTVMLEAGLDISREEPARLTNEMVERARRVVTMGCAVDAEACPAVFLKEIEDWGLPDPKGRPLAEVRLIRDTIREKVDQLLASLGAPERPPTHRKSLKSNLSGDNNASIGADKEWEEAGDAAWHRAAIERDNADA